MKHILKKKGLLLAIIMVLAFSLVACGENAINENVVMDDANLNEVNSDDVDTDDVNMEEEADEVASTEEDAVKLDSNLSGLELLQSITNTPSKTMRVEAEMTTAGWTMKSVTYIDGDKTRLETDMGESGISVTINLPEEDAIYYYIEGSTEGSKIVGMSEEEALENGYITDDAELFAEITNQGSEDMMARVETLDGEEVIYIEATEAAEDMGEVLVQMWYSVEYAMPLKYQITSGEELVASYNIIAIEKNTKLDQNLFQPPAEVDFLEADIGGMFDADMFDDLLEQ